jgi:hypothetical protein
VSNDEAASIMGVLDRQGFLSGSSRLSRGASIVVGVPYDALLSTTADLPPASSGAPIDQIARDELARSSRVNAGQIECDWWRLPSAFAPGQRPGSIQGDAGPAMIVGCTHDAADAIIGALDTIRGPGVSALDTRGLALRRAANPASDGCSLVCVLDLSWQCASISICVGDTLVYERVLDDCAWRTLHTRVCSELSIDPVVADHILRTIGSGQQVATPAERHVGAPDTLRRVRLVLTDYVNQLAGDISIAMEYTARRFFQQGVSNADTDAMQRLLIIGEGARTPDLAMHLGECLAIRTQTLRPSGVCATPPGGMTGADDPAITGAVGLSMWRPQANREQRQETAA